ncbi:hypothetical protein TV39_02080 [Arthrobacter sp. SPG23]|uniref:hypothetical protein n=1 Tax=Arthrobacter sp. SPG23 TaxID=1610703 RepID=UPI0005B932E5|nr:hypothetical protein [Arthrobacter sp. SPG23]KIS28932.1 hypothetical protein TV39_02080 [Arthrobacter sp. SPG23]
MAVCDVLRCQNQPTERFITNEDVFMEAAVCGEHMAKLSAGEGWEYNGMDRELVMGSDLAPALVNFEITECVGNGATLTIERAGDEKPYTVWLSEKDQREIAAMFY